MKRISPPLIKELDDNEVFVFGSNLAGIHGKGAARTAAKLFGAERGVAEGPTGRCYAIPVKDAAIKKALPLDKIGLYIWAFIRYAHENKKKRFLVVQIGCGLAGYKPYDIAPLFFKYTIPENVWLPIEFWNIIGQCHPGPENS